MSVLLHLIMKYRGGGVVRERTALIQSQMIIHQKREGKETSNITNPIRNIQILRTWRSSWIPCCLLSASTNWQMLTLSDHHWWIVLCLLHNYSSCQNREAIEHRLEDTGHRVQGEFWSRTAYIRDDHSTLPSVSPIPCSDR